jgi:hypothetical protein
MISRGKRRYIRKLVVMMVWNATPVEERQRLIARQFHSVVDAVSIHCRIPRHMLVGTPE